MRHFLVLRVVHGALDKITRPPVLTAFALVGTVMLGQVAVEHLRSLSGPSDIVTGITGDFPAFWTGARLIADGRGHQLYDLGTQERLQVELAGAPLKRWQPYLNPPLLVIVVRAFADLNYVHAFLAFTGLMVAAGLLGCWALLSSTPGLGARPLHRLTVALLVLSFHPMIRTMIGGQNTVLTWSLLTSAYAALRSGHPLLAGLCLGAQTYKPQFVPLIGAWLLWQRQWSAIAGIVAGALTHYILGVAFVGPDWPVLMLKFLWLYRPMEWGENVATHFSLLAFFGLTIPGVMGKLLASLGALAAVILAFRKAGHIGPQHHSFGPAWAVLVTATMLISPHMQYYDFGILTLPVVLAIETMIQQGRPPGFLLRLSLASAFVAYPLVYPLATTLGFQPLTIGLVLVFVWSLYLIPARRREVPA